MKTRTVEQIIERARQYADAETDDGTVDLETNAELLVYLNEAYAEMVDDILANNGLDLLITSEELTAPYDIATLNVYRSVALEVPSGELWTPLRRFMFRERNRYSSTTHPAWRILNGELRFYPETATPATVQLWFVPDATTFVESDDVPVWSGWDTYISSRIAQKIMIKEERYNGELDEEFKAAKTRVIRACAELDLGSSEQIVDTMTVAEDLFDCGVFPETLPRP